MKISRSLGAWFALVAWSCATLVHAANPPTIVLVSGEDEYHSAETLPAFAKFLETNYSFKTVYLERKPKPEAVARVLETYYNLNDHLTFSLEGINVTDEIERLYDTGDGTQNLTREYTHTGAQWFLGVRYRL